MGRDAPVGIGIEAGLDALARCDAADLALIDVDLDLQRFHVDQGGHTRAGKSAAGGGWRQDFADLGVFGDDNTGEGRAHDMALDQVLLAGDHDGGSLTIGAGGGELGDQAVNLRPGGADIGLGPDIARRQLAGAGGDQACLGQLRVERADAGGRGIELGLQQVQLDAGTGIVEQGQDLAFLDARAFLDQHVADAPGNLGRDGGLAPRHDIARCDQSRCARCRCRARGF